MLPRESLLLLLGFEKLKYDSLKSKINGKSAPTVSQHVQQLCNYLAEDRLSVFAKLLLKKVSSKICSRNLLVF